MPSQWQYDMGQCGTCFLYGNCESRKQILAVLSAETNRLNTAEADGAAGSIMVQCSRGQVTPQCIAQMMQCLSCAKSDLCYDRKALQLALSQLSHALNTAADAVGGVTTISVICRRS